ncbi:MAG TPA: 7-carboxy-7-deazaguanine synthase QueE [Candidatus Nitrosocosmicus sp.]|nr:7-carboxy-7-deazaguanine synthase QueE [Candidatus Nitrosocosmicus sp.]
MQRTENKARARVSEIFTSIEGEGIFVGKKTLFIRFSGCHLKCRWCDTKYALPLDSGTDYQIDEIKDLIIKELQPFTYKVNFTGGEPLLQTEAVIGLADFIKKQTNLKTYIESSCFDSELFSKILPYIDICKVEFKTDDSKVVENEEYDNLLLNEIRCLELAVESNKATYIKIVVTNSTNLESFKNLVYNISKKIKPSDILGFIIQPSFGIDQPTVNMLLDTYDVVQPMFPEVRIIPQLHKEIGAR